MFCRFKKTVRTVMRIPIFISTLTNLSVNPTLAFASFDSVQSVKVVYQTFNCIPTMRKQLSLRSSKDSNESKDTKDGEKSKKKLSFREPEVEGNSKASTKQTEEPTFTTPESGAIVVYPGGLKKLESGPRPVREVTFNLERSDSDSSLSLDDLELESQAMRIVRTVGQAFEVCHKLSLTQAASSTLLPSSQGDEDIPREKILDVGSEITQKGILASSGVTEKDNASGNASDSIINISPNSRTKAEKSVIKESDKAPSFSEEAGNTSLPEGTPLGVYHQVQLLKEQLEQQAQQTQATSAQLHLLKDQLSAETAARMEAQTQNSHLLQHNKELLEHIRVLVKHIQDLENKVGSKTEMPSTVAQNIPHSMGLPDFLRMEVPAAQPSPSSHTSPSLGRSNSANYPSSSADAFMKRSGIVRSPSSVSGARFNTNQPDQSSSISQLLGGLSLPSSPTLQSSGYSNTSLSGTGTTSNFESLFQGILGNSQLNQANRTYGSSSNTGDSVSSYLRPPDSPSSSKLSTPPAISTASSSIFANTLASLPKLNPPPQKTRATKPLEQLSMFASSRSWTDSPQAGPSMSENPSRLTTSDILTWSPQIPSSSLNRQYSPSVSRSPITNRANTKDQDTSVSQVLRDLSKINLSDRDTSKGSNSKATDSRASTFYQS